METPSSKIGTKDTGTETLMYVINDLHYDLHDFLALAAAAASAVERLDKTLCFTVYSRRVRRF